MLSISELDTGRSSGARVEPERALLRAALLRMLQDVGVALSKAESEERAIRIVERIVCRSGPWQAAHAYRVQELDGRTLLVPTGVWFSKDKRRFETRWLARAGRSIRPGKGLVGHTYRSGKPTYIRDINRLSPRARPAVSDIDVSLRAALILPTASSHGVHAVLEFYATDSVDFAADWLAAAGSIGAQLGGLLARKELERAVAEHDLEERRAMSRELHDSISQQVTALGLMVGRVQRKLKRVAPEEAAEVDKVAEEVGRLKEQVRAFIDDLGPLEITSTDLVSSLRQLAERTADNHGIVCEIQSDELHSELEPSVAQQLLYIAREAVHNAVKYGGGSRVTLSYRDTPHRVVLSIRDEGQGFAVGSKEGAGRGLTIMRYRAGLIGAHLNVASRPGQGTVVRCVLPKRAGD